MKRYGGLWPQVIDWQNLLLAAAKAQRGKRDRRCVQRFNFDQEQSLCRLQDALSSGAWCLGSFTTHWITRPKPRMISAAPYPDRVVHHAIMNVLEPLLDRHFHPHSYACRQGKGTHAAADRVQRLMRRNTHLLQCDVRKFFPSIDHEILKDVFRQRIKDRRLLSVLDRLVDGANTQERTMEWFEGDDLLTPASRRRGLPIGNLTSQWFSNWYLDELDHHLTSGLGIGGYVRYCDDFMLFHNDRERLKDARAVVQDRLAGLRLRLHEHKTAITPSRAGATFVGFRIWPTHRLLRKQNVHAFRRRVRWMQAAYQAGRLDWDAVKTRLNSWIGHASMADSRHLIKRISREWVFLRGRTDRVSGGPRRQLEQQSQELPVCEPQQEQPRQPEQQQRVPCRPALEPGLPV
jgi:retron-type reverse transcriptase